MRCTAQPVALVGVPYCRDSRQLPAARVVCAHHDNDAEMSVRNLLREVAERAGTTVLEATDYLDDGSPVCVKQLINRTFSLKLIIDKAEGRNRHRERFGGLGLRRHRT